MILSEKQIYKMQRQIEEKIEPETDSDWLLYNLLLHSSTKDLKALYKFLASQDTPFKQAMTTATLKAFTARAIAMRKDKGVKL